MNKKIVLRKLSQLKGQLTSQCGVSKIGLFGFTVRGENSLNSDIDILIDFEEDRETYSNFLSVCDILENFFKKSKLDIFTYKRTKSFYR